MNRKSAEFVSQLMIRIGQELDASVAKVREIEGETETCVRYRRAVGRIMGELLLDVLNPIFEEHPDLKPSQLNAR